MDLFKYYRAGFPFICVKTTEFKRVEQIVLDQYVTIKQKAFWDYETGFTIYENATKRKIETFDPSQVLAEIDGFNNHSQGGSVTVLRNFENFLETEYTGSFGLREKIINRKSDWKKVLQDKTQLFKQVIIICEKRPDNLPEDIPIIEFPLLKEKEIIEIMSQRFEHKGQKITPQLAKLAVGMDEIEIENALALGLSSSTKLDENGKKVIDPEIISRYKINKIKKFFVVEPSEPPENIAGLDRAISHIRLIKKAFTDEGRKYGLPYPKIIMTVGIFGTGKTLLARIISHILELPLISLDLGTVYHPLQGRTEENIREVIRIQEAMAPVIVLLDEIEKGMAGMSGTATKTTDSTSNRVFATLLKYIAEKESPVIYYATCNDITKMPSVLLRRGRTDIIFFVEIPTLKERMGIIPIHIKKYGFNPKDFDIKEIANKTPGFVGGEIRNSIEMAMFDCCPNNLTTKAIIARCEKEKILSKTKKGKKDIDYIRTWAKDIAVPASSPEDESGTGRFVDPALG